MNLSTISRNLKTMGITYRRKKQVPKYAGNQLNGMSTRARRLHGTLLSGIDELIVVDEKCSLLNNESISANPDFYTSGFQVQHRQ